MRVASCAACILMNSRKATSCGLASACRNLARPGCVFCKSGECRRAVKKPSQCRGHGPWRSQPQKPCHQPGRDTCTQQQEKRVGRRAGGTGCNLSTLPKSGHVCRLSEHSLPVLHASINTACALSGLRFLLKGCPVRAIYGPGRGSSPS